MFIVSAFTTKDPMHNDLDERVRFEVVALKSADDFAGVFSRRYCESQLPGAHLDDQIRFVVHQKCGEIAIGEPVAVTDFVCFDSEHSVRIFKGQLANGACWSDSGGEVWTIVSTAGDDPELQHAPLVRLVNASGDDQVMWLSDLRRNWTPVRRRATQPDSCRDRPTL